jgi:hypothetical protein
MAALAEKKRKLAADNELLLTMKKIQKVHYCSQLFAIVNVLKGVSSF